MKYGAVLLLLAATAAAQDPLGPDELREIDELVELLDDPITQWRAEAHRLLLAYGQRVVPVLREYDPDSAEARSRIQAILRRLARLELRAELQTSRYALGAPVIVGITIENHTDHTYLLPLGAGEDSTFALRIGDRTGTLAATDIVILEPDRNGSFVELGPGARLRLRTAVRPEHLPRRAAGTYELRIRYLARKALLVDEGPREAGEPIHGDPVAVELDSNVLKIDISTRTPAELEEALQDPKLRTRALVELQLREDDAVIPLLRRLVDDPDLRLHAILRLGEKGDPQDLELIRKATGDADVQVRVAATTGLGNFADDRARRRLSLLARQDEELRVHAVRALRNHKGARTIDAYAAILGSSYREGPWVPVIQQALREWTGLTVRNTPSEINAFRRWWQENRERWMRENPSGK